MTDRLVLASTSATRQRLLARAGVAFELRVPRVDEAEARRSLAAAGTAPRDVADALAELKASRARAGPGELVLGADQVLEHRGAILGKPASPEEARAQLGRLNGERHALHSAAVLFDESGPVWRHVATARLTMRAASPDWLDAYLARNWPAVSHSVGGYLIEDEGVRLFSRIEGDFFTVLGLPLLPLLLYLTDRGTLRG